MKNLILTLMLIAIPVFSQGFTRIDITLSTDQGEFRNYNKIGVHPEATYELDETLGEKDLPPITPPGNNLHGYITFVDTLDSNGMETIYTREEYKPIPSGKPHFHHRYRLEVSKNSTDTLTINWENIPAKIDSAFLIDEADMLFKVDMKEVNSFKIPNVYIENFYFDVYYSKITSVDDAEKNKFELYPNPARDVINLNLSGKNDIIVYDLNGRKVLEKTGHSVQRLDVSGLDQGFYIIHIKGNTSIVKKFMKI